MHNEKMMIETFKTSVGKLNNMLESLRNFNVSSSLVLEFLPNSKPYF